MKEFFESLKQAREKRQMSLEELHQRTRLPLHVLRAIENGDVEKLPSGYDRLYIRRYAKEVGLDPDQTVRDYDLFTGRRAPVKPQVTEAPTPPPSPSPTRSSRNTNSRIRETLSEINWDFWYRVFWATGILILLIIIGYFSYQQYSQVSQQQVEIKEISVPELLKEIQPAAGLTDSVQKTTVSNPQQVAPTFTVILKGLARTWIREIRDGVDTTEYILPKGLARTIKAHEKIKFTIGRADGVQILLNGVALDPLGDSTQVVTSLVVTPDGIIQKYVKTPKRQKPRAPQTFLEPPTPRLRPPTPLNTISPKPQD